jgi:hypothetical protein
MYLINDWWSFILASGWQMVITRGQYLSTNGVGVVWNAKVQ